MKSYQISSLLMLAGILGLGTTTFFACADETKTVGVVEPKLRTLPLTPGSRGALTSRGARCSPESGGPVLCTWSSDEASCTLIFDTRDVLTRLDCSVDSISYTCTLRNSLYVCTWSDEPSCAQVFFSDGTYADYACGDALEAFVVAGGRGVPGACPTRSGPVTTTTTSSTTTTTSTTTDDCLIVGSVPRGEVDGGVDAEGEGGRGDGGAGASSDAGPTVSGEGMPIFVHTVAPIIEARCANAACHGSGQSPRLSSGDFVALYLEVLSSGLAGAFDANAPIVTMPGPIGRHFTTYTTEEMESILTWLEEERITRGL